MKKEKAVNKATSNKAVKVRAARMQKDEIRIPVANYGIFQKDAIVVPVDNDCLLGAAWSLIEFAQIIFECVEHKGESVQEVKDQLDELMSSMDGAADEIQEEL